MTEEFFDPTSQESEETYFGRMANAYVQRFAPVPDPEPDDYAESAEAAGYAVFNYLTQTSGASVASEGVSGISSTYVNLDSIKSLVRPIMGDYYTGGPSGSIRTRYIRRA